jgi:hypothetical protein
VGADFEFLIDWRQIDEVGSEVKALTEVNQRLQQLANIESRTLGSVELQIYLVDVGIHSRLNVSVFYYADHDDHFRKRPFAWKTHIP